MADKKITVELCGQRLDIMGDLTPDTLTLKLAQLGQAMREEITNASVLITRDQGGTRPNTNCPCINECEP